MKDTSGVAKNSHKKLEWKTFFFFSFLEHEAQRPVLQKQKVLHIHTLAHTHRHAHAAEKADINYAALFGFPSLAVFIVKCLSCCSGDKGDKKPSSAQEDPAKRLYRFDECDKGTEKGEKKKQDKKTLLMRRAASGTYKCEGGRGARLSMLHNPEMR